MRARRQPFTRIWLWTIGLVCLALPFFWWPRPVQLGSIAVGAVGIALLGLVIWSGEKGRPLDPDRSPVSGYLGVLSYGCVIVGAVFLYRAVVL